MFTLRAEGATISTMNINRNTKWSIGAAVGICGKIRMTVPILALRKDSEDFLDGLRHAEADLLPLLSEREYSDGILPRLSHAQLDF